MLTLSCLFIYTGWMCFICLFLPVMYFWMLLLTILCFVACFIVLRLLNYCSRGFSLICFCCLSRLDLRSIHRSIDWLIDRSIIVWLVISFGHCFRFCALCPRALWPLRVSVGPSWFCRADFSDDKVQKLGAISTETAWRWLITTPSEIMGETHRKNLARVILAVRPSICIG